MNTPYPFASSKLKTDGANILASFPDTKNLVNANAGGQIELDGVIKESLSEFIYDENHVTAWELVRGPSPIFIDPKLNLGRSSIRGITTESIYNLWVAENSSEFVAKNFGLSETEVKIAVSFEKNGPTLH